MSKHRQGHSFFISIRGGVRLLSDNIVSGIDIDSERRRSTGLRQTIPLNQPNNTACALPSATGAVANR